MKTAHFGLWKSHLDPETVLDKAVRPEYPFRHEVRLFWLQTLSGKQGRTALMAQSQAGRTEVITPDGFDIRTRVNEYGGRCFCIAGDRIVFNNFDDGCLYVQKMEAGATPSRLAAWGEGPIPGFADLETSPDGRWIVAVMETPNPAGENSCRIVAIRLEQESGAGEAGRPIVPLVSGADFYAGPAISPDGGRLAWIEWSHPHMPWDRARLMRADIRAGDPVSIENPAAVVDREGWSVCQSGFLHDGELIFVSDNPECDFWNFYRFTASGEVSRISDEKGEFGEAHWVFGQRRWCELEAGTVAAVLTERDGDRIVRLDTKTGTCRSLSDRLAGYSHLGPDDSGALICVAHHEDRIPEIVRIAGSSGAERDSGWPAPAIRKDAPSPEFVEYSTTRGEVAYGYFYRPHHPGYRGHDGTRPPLVVMVHGGPTGRSSREYAGIRHYFCSLGFALLDINHRGSTGFGRTFRQSLLGNWGIDDCDDIVAGIRHVIDEDRVDADLVFIRGGSAGGYAVLRALTRCSELFCAGASYYGIGNLITLSEITHRFESRYTDRLLGETFDRNRATSPESRFTMRSPVFEMDRLDCPLILFQGSDDRVVPPEVSREVVELLRKKDIRHAYHEYPGEGHGFRQKATRIDALTRETDFFVDIIRERRGVG